MKGKKILDLRRKSLRTIKVSRKDYEEAVMQKAQHAEFVRIPSICRKSIFFGLKMGDGIWVAWPERIEEDPEYGLTPEQMEHYEERYGKIPDLFTPRNM